MDSGKSNTSLQITMSALQLFVVCGEIRLSLRHPGNCGPSRKVAQEFLNMAEETLINVGIVTRKEIEEVRREQGGLQLRDSPIIVGRA